MIVPVVLAGGVGSRLWPMSRETFPKHCVPLLGENKSTLQSTFERLKGIAANETGIVISNHQHRFLVAQQLADIGRSDVDIILEPEGRNTAPAIALAAFKLYPSDPDAMMLVLPADHMISDFDSFTDTVLQAIDCAKNNHLVTFGVNPTYPETGYGYIKSDVINGLGKADQFVEKPDADTAKRYIDAENFYWNSGMFVFKASVYLQELESLQPEIYQACQQVMNLATKDLDFTRVHTEAFLRSPSVSIDYAVMEKTNRAHMVVYHGDWSDVGSWSALYDLKLSSMKVRPVDGNVFEGDVLSHESRNNYVKSESGLVSLVGVNDLVVVQTADALLVADQQHSQDVKHIVEQLKSDDKRTEHLTHLEVHRPWGLYRTVDSGEGYQVKRILVKPGEKLSVQKHRYRAEHWVVVKGTAKVTKGDEVSLISENESTYIPVGEIHALENPGTTALHIIEVQSGSYLGEDDIVRFTDRYGRS